MHYTQPYTSRFVLGQPKTDDDKLGEIVAYRTSKDGKLHLPDEKNEQKFEENSNTISQNNTNKYYSIHRIYTIPDKSSRSKQATRTNRHI